MSHVKKLKILGLLLKINIWQNSFVLCYFLCRNRI